MATKIKHTNIWFIVQKCTAGFWLACKVSSVRHLGMKKWLQHCIVFLYEAMIIHRSTRLISAHLASKWSLVNKYMHNWSKCEQVSHQWVESYWGEPEQVMLNRSGVCMYVCTVYVWICTSYHKYIRICWITISALWNTHVFLGSLTATFPTTGGPDTATLCNELVGVSDWHKLGLYLGVQDYELDQIERSHPTEGCSRLKQETFSLWLRRAPNASWRDVVGALRRMGENTEAERIELKYIVGPVPASKLYSMIIKITLWLEDNWAGGWGGG